MQIVLLCTDYSLIAMVTSNLVSRFEAVFVRVEVSIYSSSLSRVHLQLLPEPLDFVQQEVDIRVRRGAVGYDHAEEVGFIAQWLIPDHGTSFLHHHCFDFRRHLVKQNEDNVHQCCHRPIGPTI